MVEREIVPHHRQGRKDYEERPEQSVKLMDAEAIETRQAAAYRTRLERGLKTAESIMDRYRGARTWKTVDESDLQTVGRLLAVDFDINLDRIPPELSDLKARVLRFFEWDRSLGYGEDN